MNDQYRIVRHVKPASLGREVWYTLEVRTPMGEYVEQIDRRPRYSTLKYEAFSLYKIELDHFPLIDRHEER